MPFFLLLGERMDWEDTSKGFRVGIHSSYWVMGHGRPQGAQVPAWMG